MSSFSFDDGDARQLAERGIPLDEAERQLALFERPPARAELVRPCTVGDGIVRLSGSDTAELHARHAEAAEEGRFTKFVPASGAATRMFKELLFFHRGAGRDQPWNVVREQAGTSVEAAALLRFFEELPRFAFHTDLQNVLERRGQALADLSRTGSYGPLLDALLAPEGMGYELLPKGLLEFHAYEDGARTPFEEHLVEAARYARDRNGRSRLHFTVSPEHRDRFRTLLDSVRTTYLDRYDTRFDVGFSVQKPSTDTLAVDLDNRPLRDETGSLVFRPGGHGALIENLHELEADLLFIKNIDNVQPDRRKAETLRWKPRLAGYLVRLQREVFAYLERLRSREAPVALLEEVREFVRHRLHVEADRVPESAEASRDFLIDRLDRPLRVCGVVPNTGEPGGGPFWVRAADGTIGLQIVETAQVDAEDEAQQAVLRSSTHFNPVDLVCAVRKADGRPYDLRRFIDPDAGIVTRKSAAGRELKALERPGLWNGAMAGWNTVFVEVPIETFSPVKTVLDLLRDEHQPA